MQKIAAVAFALLLVLHGLVHFIGTLVYMQLAPIGVLPYETALLGGRWELHDYGMQFFGALWVVPAVGFVLAGVALLAGRRLWIPLVVGTTPVSLVMTVLDLGAAYRGAVLNVLILATVWLIPILRSRLSTHDGARHPTTRCS